MKKLILKIGSGAILAALLFFNTQVFKKSNYSDMALVDMINKASADSEFYCDGPSGYCYGMSMIYMPCVYQIWQESAECVITYNENDECPAFEQKECGA